MALKQFNPTTPGRRGLILVDRSNLWKGDPEKKLTVGLKSTGGRNNYGRVTAWHRGGGHKKLYRIIDFKRKKFDVEAVVERMEYDPNRTCFIALIKYSDGELAYIIAPQRLSVGDKVISGNKCDIKPGNAMAMYNIPVGTIVHNIELKAGAGGKMARAAGSYAQIVGKDAGYVLVKLKSGELRKVRGECLATIGSVSNPALPKIVNVPELFLAARPRKEQE
jgi:large subunit ribosomal protein L2